MIAVRFETPKCAAAIAALPALALLAVAVGHQREHVRVLDAVEPQAERDPEAHREPLPERAGRDLDAGGPGHVRVALEVRVELAQAHQVLVREVAVARERRVLDRRRVPLGQHEAVAAGPPRAAGSWRSTR